jgi:ubiquinone/menaquinone biosynthesis C-methylase UbiE
MLKKLQRKIKRVLGIKELHGSETAKVRHLVLDYCVGRGCDIGFGGDKVKKENCLGIDYAEPYAYAGTDKVDIACDVMNEPIPVHDSTFDYVYTSHLIEDFEDTSKGIKEFARICKDGGNLILVFPDQKKYEEHCRQTGQPVNLYHKHAEMGLDFMKKVLDKTIPGYKILLESNCEIDYNVIMVIQVKK